MSQLFMAFDGGLAVLDRHGDAQWTAKLALDGKECKCLAVDPHGPRRVYCGTFDAGLWRSDDGGDTWQPVEGDLPHRAVTAVAVSPLTAQQGTGVLWAGTEPSALFRSQDGGRTWQECAGLQSIPSKPTWSFPPRPWTHHVRWIEPDPTVADRLFVGIELGGVMRSTDGGKTWEDRKPGSQHDCHTLRTHPDAPGVIYEAAGGGFAASYDGGDTWTGDDRGLPHHYLWGLAVDPGDPATVVVSASPGPRAAHNNATAQAQLYRRHGREPWQPLSAGLPAPAGTRAYALATHPSAPGVFYAASKRNLYRSTDGGNRWAQQAVDWPSPVDFTSITALAIAATDG